MASTLNAASTGCSGCGGDWEKSGAPLSSPVFTANCSISHSRLSVPTLAELLKPDTKRVSSFKVGPIYDIVQVGLAVEQRKFDYTLQTTDCSDRNSGNSRCGHNYGTGLPEEDKRALLEYLKTL